MCNDSTRLLDRRSKNRAAKAAQQIVAAKGQRGAARILKVNPGTINYIIANTDEAWKHVMLDRLLLARLETTVEYIKHDAVIDETIRQRFDTAMSRCNDLAGAMRDLRREIRKL